MPVFYMDFRLEQLSSLGFFRDVEELLAWSFLHENASSPLSSGLKNKKELFKQRIITAADLKSGQVVFRGSIGEYKKRAAKLGNALIEGDMLDGSGILFNESATFGYNWAKYCPVRYELRNGKVDRSTIVLLDNYGNPLVKKELLRAIDKYTGRLRCHIPATNRIKTYRFLDNVIIEGDRLLGNGSLFDHNISFGYVWAKYCPIRYEVKTARPTLLPWCYWMIMVIHL